MKKTVMMFLICVISIGLLFSAEAKSFTVKILLADNSEVTGKILNIRKGSITIDPEGPEMTRTYQSGEVQSFTVPELQVEYNFPVAYNALHEDLQPLFKIDVVVKVDPNTTSENFRATGIERGGPSDTNALYMTNYLQYNDYCHLMVGANFGMGFQGSSDINDQFANASLSVSEFDAAFKLGLGYSNLFALEYRGIARVSSIDVEVDDDYYYDDGSSIEAKGITLDVSELLIKVAPWGLAMNNYHTVYAYFGFGGSDEMSFDEKDASVPQGMKWKDGDVFCIGVEYVLFNKFSLDEPSVGYGLGFYLEYEEITYSEIAWIGGHESEDTSIGCVRFGGSGNIGYILGLD